MESSDGYSIGGLGVNVCVPYPDSNKVWVAEGREVSTVYSQDYIKEMNSRILDRLPRDQEKHYFRSLVE